MNIYQFLLQCMVFLLPLWRTGAYIVSGVTVIAGLVYWIKNSNQIAQIPKKFKLVTIFYLVCVIIAILFSNSYKIGFSYFIKDYSIILFLPFVVWPLFNERLAHNMIWLFALSLLVSSIIMIYQGYGNVVNLRTNGFIGHMNYAGATAILVPAILVYIHTNPYTAPKIKFIGYLIAAIAVIGSVYNGTRAIFVDLGVVGVVYALLFWKPKIKQAIAVGFTIGVLLLTVGTIKSSERIKDFNPNTMSIVTRLQMWEIGFETWKNNPILGVGVGQCPTIDFVQDHNGEWHTNLVEKKAWNDRAHLHNLVVQTITETGLVGLAGMLTYWLYILMVFLKHTIKNRNLFARVGFFGVLGFLCHSMTDYVYGITSEAILVSVLISLTFSQIYNKKDYN